MLDTEGRDMMKAHTILQEMQVIGGEEEHPRERTKKENGKEIIHRRFYDQMTAMGEDLLYTAQKCKANSIYFLQCTKWTLVGRHVAYIWRHGSRIGVPRQSNLQMAVGRGVVG